MPELNYTSTMDEDLIDQTVLFSLRDSIGEEAMQSFLERFFSDCVERTERITSAYGNARFSEVELEAHTLGTSAATYGALKLEKICREIEFARPNKSPAFQERIDLLNTLSAESLKVLKDLTL